MYSDKTAETLQQLEDEDGSQPLPILKAAELKVLSTDRLINILRLISAKMTRIGWGYRDTRLYGYYHSAIKEILAGREHIEGKTPPKQTKPNFVRRK